MSDRNNAPDNQKPDNGQPGNAHRATRQGKTAPPASGNGTAGGGKPAITESGTPEVVPTEERGNDDAAENEAPKK